MARKKQANDFWEGMLTLGGILGFGWLMVETIKLFGEERYRCPNCKTLVEKRAPECPKCKAQFNWKV